MTQSQEAVRQEALTSLRTGANQLAEGKLERAAEALVYAETVFRQLDDAEHAGESRAALAEVQRRNGAIDQSATSYERAIEFYKQADQPAREAGATLQLGHIERQRGQLDKAWERYYLALRLFEKSGNTSGQASACLAMGHVERQRGRLDEAAGYYERARTLYAQVRDAYGEADAAKGLADMRSGQRRYDDAGRAYAEALALYQKAHDRFGEVDTRVGQGRLALDRARLEEAATHFGEAIALASPLEYELGEADATLGLAEVSLHRGRLDQALADGMLAMSAYDAAGTGLGAAESNWVLGEVQLRRGQLSQAIAVFDRASRAFKSLHAGVPYVRSVLGSAEAYRRKATPRKAEDLFSEAQSAAREVEQPSLETAAMLGLARIARLRGQDAGPQLDVVARRFEQDDRPADAARALVERARLALTHGELERALDLANRAQGLAGDSEHTTGEPGSSASAVTTAALAHLALGQAESARTEATEAVALARRESDVLPLVEATLQQAETELSADNLDAAVNGFNAAAALAKQSEAALAEALAALGLGRVLLRRGLSEEAAAIHQEQLTRLRAYDDVAALALAYLGLGEAQRNLDEPDPARQAFAQAQRLYAGAGDALGEADAAYGEARVLMDVPEIEAAVGRFRQAMSLVERVGTGIGDAVTRTGFFDRQAPLYGDAIFASARERNNDRAQEVAARYAELAGRAGLAAATQRLREYEQALPTRGADLTKEQIEQAKVTGRILSDARQALSR